MNLAQRSIFSASWNAAANVARIAILFVRSVLLARLLPVETFGVYTLALSIVTLSGVLVEFGLGQALIHRAPETADEQAAADIQFTITFGLALLWLGLLLAGSFLFAEGELRIALVSLGLIYAAMYLARTPRFLFIRRVDHRRLAILDLIIAAATTIAAVGLAWRGATLGALVASDAVALLVTLIVLFLWRPIWRPRMRWDADAVRYFLSFGGRQVTGRVLGVATEDVDDIWTGAQLGDTALGYYSRAYTFASYPRRVLAGPVNAVAAGTYAELKGDRLRLSRSFFRVNALLVRTGFLVSGLLFLIAPEFIGLLLGEKWLPMVVAFRLMLVYTLVDPLKITIGSLFTAIGRPESLIAPRAIQLLLLLLGLVTLGNALGIEGVALSVDIMAVAGLVIMLVLAREHVDFSVVRLFGPPAIALVVAGSAVLIPAVLLCQDESESVICTSDWASAAYKTITFLAVFALVEVLLERKDLMTYGRVISGTIRGNRG